ncbi:hypothetical protein D3C76_939420 [compost metagenome]
MLLGATGQLPGTHATGLRRAYKDAVVRLEIVRLADRLVRRQVIGRGHQHAMGWRQLARHHPLGQFEAATNRGVETLGDQVDLPVIEMPVRIDRRKAPQKLTE